MIRHSMLPLGAVLALSLVWAPIPFGGVTPWVGPPPAPPPPAGPRPGPPPRGRRLWGAAVVAPALFEVFFGARGWFARPAPLGGVDLHPPPPRLRGTFVNPNHAALYLEI